MTLVRESRPPDGLSPEGHSSAKSLLSADDLADRWQVRRSQVYRLTRDGHVPVVRLGRYYRYRLDAVEDFENRGGAADD